ncbi:hypothetical protein CGLO_11559 [Colletotrichum gloeosporioides Cg-14]|uniref:Uncharacterized protein n=1 Tax=Colletotrichum gloeosporioides (strain Cg-14) TaxID=1237896 RepID=T0LLH6_COLGC|nr:hypothetical protein CGLO_11559 [Colletotrichum gloeosporioides Cg-14]
MECIFSCNDAAYSNKRKSIAAAANLH